MENKAQSEEEKAKDGSIYATNKKNASKRGVFNKYVTPVLLAFLLLFIGFFAGFLARGSEIKQETINAQEKKINNTTELKKEVCKVDKEIKRYEVACYDILNFDLSKCLR